MSAYYGDIHHVGEVGDGHVCGDPLVIQDGSLGGEVLVSLVTPTTSHWSWSCSTQERAQNLPKLEILKIR